MFIPRRLALFIVGEISHVLIPLAIVLMYGLIWGCAPSQNDMSEIMSTRKNDAVLAAQKAVKDCGGPVKLILMGVKPAFPHRQLVEISYRCKTVDRPGVSPDEMDHMIAEINSAVNIITRDNQTDYIHVDKNLSVRGSNPQPGE